MNAVADGAVVYAGNLQSPLDQWDQQPQFTAAEIIINPQYNETTFASDATLLFFDECMADGSTIAPIQLGSAQDFRRMKDSTLLVSGFGRTSEGATPPAGWNGAFASVLQTGNVNYVKPKTCQNLMAAAGAAGIYQSDQMICTIGTQAEPSGPAYPPLQSACSGDSGGPLAYNRKQRSVPVSGEPANDRLLGLTSWCAKKTGRGGRMGG